MLKYVILALLIILFGGISPVWADTSECTSSSREFQVPQKGADMIPYLEHLYENGCTRGHATLGAFVADAVAKNYHEADVIWLSNGDYYKLPSVVLPDYGPTLTVKKGVDVLGAVRLYHKTHEAAQHMFKEDTLINVFKFIYGIPAGYKAPKTKVYALPPMRPRADVAFNRQLVLAAKLLTIELDRLRSAAKETGIERDEVLEALNQLRAKTVALQAELDAFKSVNAGLTSANVQLEEANKQLLSTNAKLQSGLNGLNNEAAEMRSRGEAETKRLRSLDASVNGTWYSGLIPWALLLVFVLLFILSLLSNLRQRRKLKEKTGDVERVTKERDELAKWQKEHTPGFMQSKTVEGVTAKFEFDHLRINESGKHIRMFKSPYKGISTLVSEEQLASHMKKCDSRLINPDDKQAA